MLFCKRNAAMTWPTRHDPKGKDYPYLKNLPWKNNDRFLIESEMVRRGGMVRGEGMGLAHHFKCAMAALWPHLDWYDRCPLQSQWSHLLVENFITEDQVAVLGPASSGKTYISAAFGLAYLWVWPQDTTVMTSTTTKDALDYRIFGSLTELFKEARKIRPWLEGHMVASKHRMPMKPVESDDDDDDLMDKRDGVIGIACKLGDRWVGMSNYVGLKNKRVLLIADEAHLMAPGFLDSVANLRKNPTFKLFALGNPKDMLDPLGKAAEPASEIGGWNGYAGEKKTSVWRTRSGGVAIQLCGTDTPNAAYGTGLNPFKAIITPEDIERDLREYGEDSLQMAMMNYGIMPKAGSSKRVIDIQICERNKAFNEPVWQDIDDLVHVAGLDAAYSGTGGDRCVFTHLVFGHDIHGKQLLSFAEPQMIVPINPSLRVEPEVQIAQWVMGACIERKIKPSNFGLDSTGRGTLVSALARLWSPAVIPIEFGGLPDDDRSVSATDTRTEYEVYGKRVTALWYATRLIAEAGQFRRVPMDAVEEAQMREWMVTNNRRGGDAPLIDVEPKDKMKKRISRSPDLWDSACVAVEVARRLGFQIAGHVKTGFERRTSNEWMQRMKERSRRLRERETLVYA